MATAYVGEIRLFAGSWVPAGWKECNGEMLQISQFQELYALLGVVWGGDGVNTFGIPDLRGRVALGMGQGVSAVNTPLTNRALAAKGGSETVTLTAATIPAHTHPVNALTVTATTGSPAGNLFASAPGTNGFYVPAGSDDPTIVSTDNAAAIGPSSLQAAAGHNNMMPTEFLLYLICTTGIFPQRS